MYKYDTAVAWPDHGLNSYKFFSGGGYCGKWRPEDTAVHRSTHTAEVVGFVLSAQSTRLSLYCNNSVVCSVSYVSHCLFMFVLLFVKSKCSRLFVVLLWRGRQGQVCLLCTARGRIVKNACDSLVSEKVDMMLFDIWHIKRNIQGWQRLPLPIWLQTCWVDLCVPFLGIWAIRLKVNTG